MIVLIKRLLIIIITIVCLFILSRLIIFEQETDINYENFENEEELVKANEDEINFDYINVHFTHSPNDIVKVDITYPQFKDEKLANLNSKIEEFAKSNFKDIITDNNESNFGFSLEEKYEIKLATENIVSIYSSGEFDIENAAHPSAIRNVLNINPFTFIKYKINDFIDISNDFVELFNKVSESDEQLSAYLSSFTLEELKENISLSKIYFDEKDIVIIFEVPHAIGDYIEIKIENEKIQPYLKDI